MGEEFVSTQWEVDTEILWQAIEGDISPRLFARSPGSVQELAEPLGANALEEYVWVPLFAGQKRIGLISADNGVSGEPIKKESLKPIGLYAYQAGAAIETA